MTWTFNRAAHTLSHEPLAPGSPAWSCEAHGEAVAGSNGPLAPGTYVLGTPTPVDPEDMLDGEASCRAMGPYFIPVNNTPGRVGIGIHGGGSAAVHPLNAQQGWFPTLGCIRLQNVDLYHVALNAGYGDTLEVV